MTPLLQRHILLPLLEEAVASGARLSRACLVVSLSIRTVQRWRRQCTQDPNPGDRRVRGLRQAVSPPNKLSEAEVAACFAVMNSPTYQDLPASQIVPRLADQGCYLASESTLYRLLRERGQLHHRGASCAAYKRAKPRALAAVRPNQVYCWDITYLPTQVRGVFYYLYLYLDLYSRAIVGWQVFDREHAQLAADLLTDICVKERISKQQLTVHSDNGAPMRGETMLATLQKLGVAHSRSRPAVSNDNPYSESLFRTLKYRPQTPLTPFEDILQARQWVGALVQWYNHEHRHSGISFVTPGQRHAGEDTLLLKRRDETYQKAQANNPNRWSKSTRNWEPIKEVLLNPDKPQLAP